MTLGKLLQNYKIPEETPRIRDNMSGKHSLTYWVACHCTEDGTCYNIRGDSKQSVEHTLKARGLVLKKVEGSEELFYCSGPDPCFYQPRKMEIEYGSRLDLINQILNEGFTECLD